jgi:hypothetical protein
MKIYSSNVSFKRKIKLLFKEVQRKNDSDARNLFEHFFLQKRILPKNIYSKWSMFFDLRKLLNMSPEDFRRFVRLANRLSKAAKKQEKFLFFDDLVKCVHKKTDARNIKFYEKRKLSISFDPVEVEILVSSEKELEEFKQMMGKKFKLNLHSYMLLAPNHGNCIVTPSVK